MLKTTAEHSDSESVKKIRKSFRCPVTEPAPFKVTLRPTTITPGTAAERWTGEAANISPNGMLVNFDTAGQPLRVGARVTLALQTASGPTRLAATVRHCTRKQCGLEFVSATTNGAFEPPESLQHAVSSLQRQYLQTRRRNY